MRKFVVFVFFGLVGHVHSVFEKCGIFNRFFSKKFFENIYVRTFTDLEDSQVSREDCLTTNPSSSKPLSKQSSKQSSEPLSEQSSKPLSEPTKPLSKQPTKPLSKQSSKPLSEPLSKQSSKPLSKPLSEPTKPTTLPKPVSTRSLD
jgi:hypothetical protein